MTRQKATRADAAARYANAVVRVLAEEFPRDLRDPVAREITMEAVVRHAVNPTDMLEVIIDPVSATWRLKPDRDNPARVRLAFCPVNPERREDERQRRVNVALATIPED
jgi:hypothetical protein